MNSSHPATLGSYIEDYNENVVKKTVTENTNFLDNDLFIWIIMIILGICALLVLLNEIKQLRHETN